VLKGCDGGAGKLHGIMARLLEVMVWLEKGRGELSTAARSSGNGARRQRQRCVQEKKMRGSGQAKEGCSNRASSLNRQCSMAAARHGGRRQAVLAARAAAERRGSRGRRQQGSAEAVAVLPGDTWSGAGARASLERRGTSASGGAAARQRGSRVRRRGEEGRQGLMCELQKFQGPRCKTRFSHCSISQMRKWSNKEL
jgi:hypothetical protein